MQSDTIKIFIACAIGSALGGLTTLSLNSHLWWIGLLVGGLTGYLSYEFKKVSMAIRTSYLKSRMWRMSETQKAKIVDTIFMISAFIATISSASILLYPSLHSYAHEVNTTATVFWIFSISFSALLGMLGFLISMAVMLANNIRRMENARTLYRKIILGGNPIAVFIYWPIRGILKIPKIIYFLISKVPKATTVTLGALLVVAKFLGRFSKNLFLIIHDDLRLLCAVDAMIGASTCYALNHFFGYSSFLAVVTGTISGGLLGVLNYELISKRWIPSHIKRV